MDQTTQDRITAAHEAGHAIAGQSLGYVIARVSIEPTIDNIGYCGGDRHLSDLASAIWYLSGPVSESKFRQSIGLSDDYRGSEKDFDDCHQALRRLVPNLPRATLFGTPIFKNTWDDAEKLVAGLWPKIERFAEELLRHRTLTGDSLRAVLAGRPIRSIDDRRRELNAIAADLKRTRRPASPMRDSTASAMFGKMLGHCFPGDILAKYGVKIRSNAERQEILSEFRRLTGPAVAKRTVPKATASRNLVAVRARAKRQMNELNERHATQQS